MYLNVNSINIWSTENIIENILFLRAPVFLDVKYNLKDKRKNYQFNNNLHSYLDISLHQVAKTLQDDYL